MAEPFLSEIRIFSINYAPRGWAMCNGQFLPINQNQALFSLLGVTYGGNGQTTFALPDLRGRVLWDTRLELRRSGLEKQFSNLEVALGKMKQQSSWLAGQLAGLA